MLREPLPDVEPEVEFAPELPRVAVVDGFRLVARTAREICDAPDPPADHQLLGPLIGRGARTIVVADTGHGKTSLGLQLGRAVLTGQEALGYEGAGVGPLLVLDLEQGERSIKRSLRDAGLAGRDDVHYIAVPDGLALDSDDDHRAELERVIAETLPAVFVLDPYYKAHRGDSNEERAVVDLMRYLDALRARYGFALVLPAHPRKSQDSVGSRKLTLHDVAGSGAVVRGAELVLGLERLSHGYARLRILKDRDGDLPVGDAWPLIFTRGEGFKLDPKEEATADELEQRVHGDTSGQWRTSKEWAAELGVQHMKARRLLEALAETGRVQSVVGPPGRSPRAHCYRTAPAGWEQSGAVDPSLLDDGTALDALPVGESGGGSSPGATAPDPGAVTDPEEVERLAALASEMGLE